MQPLNFDISFAFDTSFNETMYPLKRSYIQRFPFYTLDMPRNPEKQNIFDIVSPISGFPSGKLSQITQQIRGFWMNPALQGGARCSFTSFTSSIYLPQPIEFTYFTMVLYL